MPENCSAKGCKVNVPAGLAAEHLCVMHFTLFIESECAEMRRESALGNTTTNARWSSSPRFPAAAKLSSTSPPAVFPCLTNQGPRPQHSAYLDEHARKYGPRRHAPIRSPPLRWLAQTLPSGSVARESPLSHQILRSPKVTTQLAIASSAREKTLMRGLRSSRRDSSPYVLNDLPTSAGLAFVDDYVAAF